MPRRRCNSGEQELSLLQAGTRREEIDEAAAQLDETRQAWELAQKGFRQEEIDQAEAARDAAQAAVAALAVRKTELQIVAPVDGVVEALELRPGDLTAAGAPVLSLVDESPSLGPGLRSRKPSEPARRPTAVRDGRQLPR